MSVSQQKLFNYEYKIAIICVISMFIYACECIGLPTLWLVCTCT